MQSWINISNGFLHLLEWRVILIIKGSFLQTTSQLTRRSGAQCPAEPAVEEVGNGGVTTNAIRSLLLSPMQTYRPGSAMERQSHSEKIDDFGLFLSPFWRLFSVFYGY